MPHPTFYIKANKVLDGSFHYCMNKSLLYEKNPKKFKELYMRKPEKNLKIKL